MSKNHRGFAGCSRLNEESGASIVIALVFFLICAIIGSVVVTAASVNAKAVQSHSEAQQAEFAVGSAAQTIGHELESAELTNVQEDNKNSKLTIGSKTLSLAETFWDQYGADILNARHSNKKFAPMSTTVDASVGGETLASTKKVYGTIEVNHDLDITVKLTLATGSDAAIASSPYNMTVYLQCIPTYNKSGALIAFSYEPAVIKKGW